MGNEDLRARLREQPAPVRYDVARGLERHRALIEAGAPLPGWAEQLPAPRAPWLRRVALWGGAMAVLTALWARPTLAPTPPPTQVTAPPQREVAPEVTRSAGRTTVQNEAAPTPAAEVLAIAPEVAAAPIVERSLPRARSRSRSHGRDQGAVASDDESVTPAERRARLVAPQENLELAQLVEAERALATDPVRALRLAREGQRSFQNGYFAQERHYIEVMALFALGRLGEAHAQAAAFLRDYPNAAYRRKIELEMLRQPQR